MYKEFLAKDSSLIIETATLREEHNTSENKLKDCDVLIWCT